MTRDTQTPAPLSWKETRALIHSDFTRLARHLGKSESMSHKAYYFLLPGFQALLYYRLSRYFYLRGWVGVSRIVSLIGQYVTRAEISPTAWIGPSAMIAHPTGVSIMGHIGARLTVYGASAIGGGMGVKDIGGGPGYPVIGDDLLLAYGARILGAVRIGNGVHVGPGALVTFDISDESLVLWDRPRVLRGGAKKNSEST